MESYIVRVYRRNSDSPEKINGMVEIVGSDIQKSFRTFEELRTIINEEAVPERAGEPGKRKKHGE